MLSPRGLPDRVCWSNVHRHSVSQREELCNSIPAVAPPVTSSVTPVMLLAKSEARNTEAFEMSSINGSLFSMVSSSIPRRTVSIPWGLRSRACSTLANRVNRRNVYSQRARYMAPTPRLDSGKSTRFAIVPYLGSSPNPALSHLRTWPTNRAKQSLPDAEDHGEVRLRSTQPWSEGLDHPEGSVPEDLVDACSCQNRGCQGPNLHDQRAARRKACRRTSKKP